MLFAGIIVAVCPSRRNDEWLCEKNTIIPYMALEDIPYEYLDM